MSSQAGLWRLIWVYTVYTGLSVTSDLGVHYLPRPVCDVWSGCTLFTQACLWRLIWVYTIYSGLSVTSDLVYPGRSVTSDLGVHCILRPVCDVWSVCKLFTQACLSE